MRTENVKIAMEIPVHFNKLDKNGYVNTKESLEEAIKNAENIPIKIFNNDDTYAIIGVTQDVCLIKKDDENIIFVSGTLLHKRDKDIFLSSERKK